MNQFDDDDMDPAHIMPSSSSAVVNMKGTILTSIAADVLSHRQQVAKMRDAYREACAGFNTAPSGYILQNIDRAHLRVAELLLGDDGVSALSLSLSRQLVSVDLSNNGVGDLGATAFAQSLEKSSLTELDLSKNQICDEVRVGKELAARSKFLTPF